jgi:hypothetical protein
VGSKVPTVSDDGNHYDLEGNPCNKGHSTDGSNDPYRFDYLHNHVHQHREWSENKSYELRQEGKSETEDATLSTHTNRGHNVKGHLDSLVKEYLFLQRIQDFATTQQTILEKRVRTLKMLANSNTLAAKTIPAIKLRQPTRWKFGGYSTT